MEKQYDDSNKIKIHVLVLSKKNNSKTIDFNKNVDSQGHK